jgi:prepilin signal peptidase PulO-like enzyme (type II secretory pathway)
MLVMLILAAGVSVGGVFLFNALPADWFCDYDETPNPDRKRLPLWAAGLFFAVLAFILLQAGAMEGLPLVLLLLFAFVCLLTAASDILYRILPDQFLVVLAALGLFYAVSTSAVFLQSLLAGVLASGLIFLLGIVGKLAFKAEAMGFGDVKLVAGLGIAAGWPGTAWGILLAVLAGGFAALPLLFLKGERRYLPFAPFLCGGFLAAMLWAKELNGVFHWYVSLF